MLQGPEGRRLDAADRIRLSGDRTNWSTRKRITWKQLKYVQQDKDQLIVRSPIDGQVVTWQVHDLLIHRPVEKGQILMKSSSPIATGSSSFHAGRTTWVISTRAGAKWARTCRFRSITATDPGATYEGKIKEVGRTAEIRGEEGNTVVIRVAINKQDLATEPRPGATVTGKIYVGRASIGYVWFHDLVSFRATQDRLPVLLVRTPNSSTPLLSPRSLFVGACDELQTNEVPDVSSLSHDDHGAGLGDRRGPAGRCQCRGNDRELRHRLDSQSSIACLGRRSADQTPRHRRTVGQEGHGAGHDRRPRSPGAV